METRDTVRQLVARALTADAYAPYGHVIEAAPAGEPGNPANQGTARRWDRRVEVQNLRPGVATLNVATFRCAPVDGAKVVTLLERHAASTQVFLPLRARAFLVVVALGGDAPDLSTLAAFVASSAQGVSYAPGVWHHPMIALGAEADFTCLVWEDGTRGDCDVRALAPDGHTLVEVPAALLATS